MLTLTGIKKEYKTGDFVQKALDGVSLNLRENEFVAVLGPSGSGKTTLLNIIGGLDSYDEGDLIIRGTSTKNYKDRDWDTYRNHSVGFIFQSYNLIPHQTILKNVSLALTIAGAGREECEARAQEALEKVGLGDQSHKKPGELSGGQMQRVAIARALVNDPDILLADEPTGALDSQTSLQVMDLLKEVAQERLVVMVTHNPELAGQYATRIVNIKDGKIVGDSDPYDGKDEAATAAENTAEEDADAAEVDAAEAEAESEEPAEAPAAAARKASMSFKTALGLSADNLLTKKARTLLIAIAGSIGIIGIALIMALSNGVNRYIDDIERETLAQYPVQIETTAFDFTSMLGANTAAQNADDGKSADAKDAGEQAAASKDADVADSNESKDKAASKDKTDASASAGTVTEWQTITAMFSQMNSNDLASLKTYLDDHKKTLSKYASSVQYKYDIEPQIFRKNTEQEKKSGAKSTYRRINPDTTFNAMGMGSNATQSSLMSQMMSTNTFFELPSSESLYKDQYELVAGKWPEHYDELVLVLTENDGMSDLVLYSMGLKDTAALDTAIKNFVGGSKVDIDGEPETFTYDEIFEPEFLLVSSSDYYRYDDELHLWSSRGDQPAFTDKLAEKGEPLHITGIIHPKKEAKVTILTNAIGYLPELNQHISDMAADSDVVKAQKASPDVNVLTGKRFDDDEADLDLGKLFSVDGDAMANAFQFDASKLSINPSAFGNFNLSSLNLPALVTGALKSDAQQQAGAVVNDVLNGFQQYAKGNRQADISKLGDDFNTYLNSAAAQKIMTSYIQGALQKQLSGMITQSTVANLTSAVMAGFPAWLSARGYTDMSQMSAYLSEYLQSAEASAAMNASLGSMMNQMGSIDMSAVDFQGMTQALAAGYPAYAYANGLVTPDATISEFGKYLSTADATNRISAGLPKIVDTNRLSAAVQSQLGAAISGQMSSAMSGLAGSIMNALSFDQDAFAGAISMKLTQKDLEALITSMMAQGSSSYEDNLRKLGYAEEDTPSEILIYPKNFESKDKIVAFIDKYNDKQKAAGDDDKVIAYTDIVGVMMSSVTDIINAISYMLIAFVSISLIVSSIMIGVITYISVLERRKEIGILRAMGASKRNVGNVFNAETFIIGALAGLLGVIIARLILIPGDAIIQHVTNGVDMHPHLPITSAAALVLLSVILTLIGGLLPSRKAAGSDPVTALRET